MLPLLVLLALVTSTSATLGGEKAFFTTPMMTPNVTHRQNMCERYELFRNKTLELKDALNGMQLHLSMAAYKGSYFNYDPETGIDGEYPGLTAIILDELARRAKFTWRNSFGLTLDPADYNTTWKDMLLWSIDTYDMQIDWWAQNIERMQMGVAFMKEWYDSSIILVSKEIPEEISEEIRWWNWLRPYDGRVWLMTVFTIFLSGVVYQILEWYADDRQERSHWEWWQENFYLSAINFTQAYEYQPKSFASRLFGISMAIWALVMTATYTANLASLLVDRKPPPIVAQTIDEVAVFGERICTWAGTWSDDFVRVHHPGATRIEKQTVLEMYQGLQNGDCDYLADAVASWNKNKALKEYNPFCNLYWVGGDRKAFQVYASFVSRVDAGDKCTGLIRDVLDLHMHDIIADGFLANAWDREYKRTADINCDTYRPELASFIEEQLNGDDAADEGTRRRQLRSNPYQDEAARLAELRRRLKATKGASAGAAVAAAAAGGDGGDATKLKLEQMIGTFAFHWFLMAIALAVANINVLYNRYAKKHAKVVTTKMRKSMRESFNMGSTRRTAEMSDFYDSRTEKQQEDSVCSEPKAQEDLQEQLDNMRISQTHMRQSQTQMERCQADIQKAQMEMLEEQRKLQAQMQAFLTAQSPSSMGLLAAMNPQSEQQPRHSSVLPQKRVEFAEA